MSDDFMFCPKSDELKLVSYVVRRIKRNQNFIGTITGGTGSGKSYTAIRLGEYLSKSLGVPFGIDNICFEPAEMMRLINTGDLPKGSVIILDEAGAVINSRTWQSKTNLLISYLTQTFRHRNLILLLCVPDFSFIDKSVRKLTHCHIETLYIDYELKISWVKPLFVQNNQRTGDLYFKFLRYYLPGGQVQKVSKTGFSLASKELLDAYEDKKLLFTNKLNQTIQRVLDDQGSEGKKPLTHKQEVILGLRNDHGLTLEQIGEVLNIQARSVHHSISLARKKGYEVEKSQKVELTKDLMQKIRSSIDGYET